jgi:hypothetical protein
LLLSSLRDLRARQSPNPIYHKHTGPMGTGLQFTDPTTVYLSGEEPRPSTPPVSYPVVSHKEEPDLYLPVQDNGMMYSQYYVTTLVVG